jgi:hypothetical protein
MVDRCTILYDQSNMELKEYRKDDQEYTRHEVAHYEPHLDPNHKGLIKILPLNLLSHSQKTYVYIFHLDCPLDDIYQMRGVAH